MNIPKSLLYVILVAFLLRLGWFLTILLLNSSGFLVYDSHEFYIPLANNLIQNGEYSGSTQAPFYPESYRLPGYPLFLALFYSVGLGNLAVIFVQILLSCFNCYLVYLLAIKLFEQERIGILAAAVLALDIPSIAYSNFLLSETLFTLLLLLSYYFLLGSRFNYRLLLAGILMGATILVRPIAVVLPPLLFLVLYVQGNLRFRPGISLVTGLGLMLLPWLIRNYLVFGTLFFSGLGNLQQMYYHAAPVRAEIEKISLSAAQGLFYEEALSEYGEREWEAVLFSRLEGQMARAYLFEHPWIYMKTKVKSIAGMMLLPMRGGLDHQMGIKPDKPQASPWDRFLNSSSTVIVLVLIQFIVILFLWGAALSASWGLFRKKKWIPLFLICGTILAFSLILGSESNARFRVPLMPLIAMMAAAGFVGKKIA